jgi:hypothetical protein
MQLDQAEQQSRRPHHRPKYDNIALFQISLSHFSWPLSNSSVNNLETHVVQQYAADFRLFSKVCM